MAAKLAGADARRAARESLVVSEPWIPYDIGGRIYVNEDEAAFDSLVRHLVFPILSEEEMRERGMLFEAPASDES